MILGQDRDLNDAKWSDLDQATTQVKMEVAEMVGA